MNERYEREQLSLAFQSLVYDKIFRKPMIRYGIIQLLCSAMRIFPVISKIAWMLLKKITTSRWVLSVQLLLSSRYRVSTVEGDKKWLI